MILFGFITARPYDFSNFRHERRLCASLKLYSTADGGGQQSEQSAVITAN